MTTFLASWLGENFVKLTRGFGILRVPDQHRPYGGCREMGNPNIGTSQRRTVGGNSTDRPDNEIAATEAMRVPRQSAESREESHQPSSSSSSQASARAAPQPNRDNHHRLSSRQSSNIIQLQVRDTFIGSDIRRTIRGIWSVEGASIFACLFCCLNFYNLSRFSLLAYYYKGQFLLQFFILTVGFALPLLLFLISIGQYLGSGIYDIWFISPAFKGIGAAFLVSYTAIGIYMSVPTSWLFVYFRDSFVATRDIPFRWAFCSINYNTRNCVQSLNASSHEYVGWSVSSYFHNKILSRTSNTSEPDTIKADAAFNLAILWSLVFLSLARGLHSTGRLIVILGTLSIFLFVAVSIRIIEQFGNGVNELFKPTGKPFLSDSTSWLFAARECFIIWISFGVVISNVFSHEKSSKHLMRKTLLLFGLVLLILFIASCFMASAMEVFKRHELVYIPSSYEEQSTTTFVREMKSFAPNATVLHSNSTSKSTVGISSVRIISGANLLLGENLIAHMDVSSRQSHYHVMRFATEIFPAVLAIEGPKIISSFWSMCFFLSALLLNFGHLIVVWGSAMDSVIAFHPQVFKKWKSIIVLVGCIIAYLFGLTMTTNSGLFILYYTDFCIGSLWWLALLYLLFVVAVLIIRGRPCGTENLVATLTTNDISTGWLLPTLTFQWNLIIPITIMVLSIAFTRSYSPIGLTWTQVVAVYPYWPPWAQYLNIMLQVTPLLLVFTVGTVQVFRYICPQWNSRPMPERLQSLFCPLITSDELTRRIADAESATANGVVNNAYIDDPPPKYSPPPSYSTATARTLAQHIRDRFASSVTIDLHYLTSLNVFNRDEGQKSAEASNLSYANKALEYHDGSSKK